MTTIINTPGNGEDSSVVSVVIGLVMVLILGVLFFMYALPAIRNSDQMPEKTNSVDVNVKLPEPAQPAAEPAQ